MSFKNELCCQTSYYKLDDLVALNKNTEVNKTLNRDIEEIKNSIKKKEKVSEKEYLANALRDLPDKSKAIVVHKNSKEQAFLNMFKQSLKKNDLPGSAKVVSNINANLITLPQKHIEKFEIDEKAKKSGDKLQLDKNFVNMINNKIDYIKKEFGLLPEEKAVSMEQKLNANQIELFSMITKMSNNIPPNVFKMRKIKRILMDALSFLYFNNISLFHYLKGKRFNTEAYIHPKSKEYFEAIKFNKPITLSKLVSNDNALLLEIDYFGQSGYHWAAKRGYTSILNVLILAGKHINMTDNKNRTPLYLASESNYYDCCDILLNNGANPFIINFEDKKPLDVTTNQAIKRLIYLKMDAVNYLNLPKDLSSYVIRYHLEELKNGLIQEEKERALKQYEGY